MLVADEEGAYVADLKGRKVQLPVGSSDAALARLYDKDAKAPQFDAFTAGQCFLHRMKESVHGLFRFQFRDAGFVGKTVDDIKFNHGLASNCNDRSWTIREENSSLNRVSWMIESGDDNCQAFVWMVIV